MQTASRADLPRLHQIARPERIGFRGGRAVVGRYNSGEILEKSRK
jgi:hypothetical protein